MNGLYIMLSNLIYILKAISALSMPPNLLSLSSAFK